MNYITFNIDQFWGIVMGIVVATISAYHIGTKTGWKECLKAKQESVHIK